MPRSGKGCGLGKILETEGKEKHDEVLTAIFTIDPNTGRLHSDQKLVDLFASEYGWSEFFFRRHKAGKCVSCLKRT